MSLSSYNIKLAISLYPFLIAFIKGGSDSLPKSFVIKAVDKTKEEESIFYI